MNAKGPVFKYGDNIDTDVIIPARYLNTQSAAELASHWERAGLFRCSRSAVVDLWAIRHLKSRPGGRIEATLATGERLVISRHYAPLLRERGRENTKGAAG